MADALRRRDVAFVFGWQDVAQRYRRSKVGAFWLTINMAVLIAALGLIFGTLFDAPMAEFLPFIGAGLIIWAFISTTLTDACIGFIQAEGIILHARLPLFTHILRLWWRNIIILAHNLVIIPVLLLLFGRYWGVEVFLLPAALVLTSANLLWMGLILAVFCTRYRDMPLVVQNVIQVLFYATPLLWMPDTLPDRVGSAFLDYNPFYHLVSIMRAPLIGEIPTPTNWLVSFSLAVVGWMGALALFGRYRHRIAYWL